MTRTLGVLSREMDGHDRVIAEMALEFGKLAGSDRDRSPGHPIHHPSASS
jgi:hypothetical protein